MNILFIFNGTTKTSGVGLSGGTIRLFEIMKFVQAEKVSVLTTPNGEELLEKLHVPYDEKHLINYRVDNGIKSNLTISLKSFFQIPKLLKDYKGVVYSSCEHMYDVFPALRLKFQNGCKWYAVYHWVEEYPWKDKRGGVPFMRRYLYWANRAFAGLLIKLFADKILAVSDQTKVKLIKIKKVKPEKIQSVYCGVEYDEITKIIEKYHNEKGKIYDAVYMKRLDYGKGIFDLLTIWKKVCDVKLDAKLAIIGDGSVSTLEKIHQFLTENNMEENVSSLGVIYDFEEKFRILNSSKMFLLPSHEENWAIVIGEAMAAKLPVIVYDLKEIVPIWQDNVEWIKFGDTGGFADKIVGYLENINQSEAIAEKAYQFIRKYDWRKIAKQEFI